MQVFFRFCRGKTDRVAQKQPVFQLVSQARLIAID
jgi:hypothetical protein